MWMAQVASTRLEQMQDPEKSIDQAVIDHKRLGYSDAWINQRPAWGDKGTGRFRVDNAFGHP